VVFWDFSQLGDFFSENEKEKIIILRTLEKFSPFKKMKRNKLATSKPRHFLGCHLSQHFYKKYSNPLEQWPLNAN